MCSVCGCGHDQVTYEDGHGQGHPHGPDHDHHERTHHDDEHAHDYGGARHPHGHGHERTHDNAHPHDHGQTHEHVHEDGHDHDHGRDPKGRDHLHDHATASPGPSAGPAPTPTPRILRLEQDLLAKNDQAAGVNRGRLATAGIFAVNLMSSPGTGKTTLLVATLERLGSRVAAAVIEGDQQTALDAERIRATGTRALQINTGQGCHLDAAMIAGALDRLALPAGSLLLIENVGNLVCPAAFDLGEAARVVVVSLTEGDDKPLKYPNMFAGADLVVINKIDLAPYLPADAERLAANVRRINRRAGILRLSATTGAGLDRWCAWLEAGLSGQRALADDTCGL